MSIPKLFMLVVLWLCFLALLTSCTEVGIYRFTLFEVCAAWSNVPAPVETAHEIARVCER